MKTTFERLRVGEHFKFTEKGPLYVKGRGGYRDAQDPQDHSVYMCQAYKQVIRVFTVQKND